MSYSSNAWNDALSEVGDGGVIAKILGVAYDSARFSLKHCAITCSFNCKGRYEILVT
ncbi:hypothetical protein NIES4075_08210 [Tolypothrix sp. NIES-4075]|uniref:hypothetical protein n=1 Tax=Tolypothrix sp. NIES-4075 TaxID=2005459 RepID=UPI000B6F8BD7|nr:hypothetical protein [Tolypothrix sp. NIES-4075]GAX39861.1 hypothetical protein NIES4075_08210 [Tolypothrix sp. NIES-4075]